jgi:hypothetical protein
MISHGTRDIKMVMLQSARFVSVKSTPLLRIKNKRRTNVRSSVITELPSKIMTLCTPNRAAFVQAADKATRVHAFTSTTATQRAKFVVYFATSATLPWGLLMIE